MTRKFTHPDCDFCGEDAVDGVEFEGYPNSPVMGGVYHACRDCVAMFLTEKIVERDEEMDA